MYVINRFVIMLLCVLLCAPLAQARPTQDKPQETPATRPIAQDVLIIIQQEQVRFTAPSSIAEMRLQIFDQAGQLVYDSGAVTEPELTWVLRQANGEAVKSGLYAYTLSVKGAGVETARVRHGHFIVDRAKERDGQTDRLWITSQNESGVGTELTVARNEGETIAGTSVTGERKSVTAERVATRDGEAESKDENNATAAPAAANGTTGRIAKFTSATDLGNSVMTELNSNIGIGITNPLSKLHISAAASDLLPPRVQAAGANSFAAGWDFYHGTTGKGYVGVPGPSVGLAPGELILFGASGTPTSIWGGGVMGITVATNGSVGIGTTTPSSKLEIAAQDGLRITGYQPFLTLTDTNAGWVWNGRIQNVNGGLNFQTHDLTSVGGSAMYIQDATHNVGIGTSSPQHKLDVIGVTKTNLLLITGGADFAENFDVNVATTSGEATAPKVEAGMIVSIDPASPGKLQLSTRAYDRRVAGIISGAGGVKPGTVMNQEGTLADGKHPVALTGRVYCWVDASRGAIEPGDLLTTSSTPGHAMKAADAVKAHGAIIGKAMTGLKEGKGLVLVLVTLQ